MYTNILTLLTVPSGAFFVLWLIPEPFNLLCYLFIFVVVVCVAIFTLLLVRVRVLETAVVAMRGTEAVISYLPPGFHLLLPQHYIKTTLSTDADVFSHTTQTTLSGGGVDTSITWTVTYCFDPNLVPSSNYDFVTRIIQRGHQTQFTKRHISNILRCRLQGYEIQHLVGKDMQADLEDKLKAIGQERLGFFGIRILNLVIDAIVLPDHIRQLIQQQATLPHTRYVQQYHAEMETLLEHIRHQTKLDKTQREHELSLKQQTQWALFNGLLSETEYARLRDTGVLEALLRHGFPPSYLPYHEWAHWFSEQQTQPNWSIRPRSRPKA